MKNVMLIMLFITTGLYAQDNTKLNNKDYRTSEDGLNKLLNNSAFIADVVKLGNEDLTLDKLDSYLSKYVPEYSNFKLDSKIDFNAIYYANSSGINSQSLGKSLGKALKLDVAQNQLLQNIIDGNISYVSSNNMTKGYGDLLYQRGKDKNLDFALDYSNDVFQNKFGDGGVKSSLIDLGTGLAGNIITQLNKRYYEKLAEQQRIDRILGDHNVYSTGGDFVYDDKVKKVVLSHSKEQEDLYNHYLGNQNMSETRGFKLVKPNYDEAIKNLDKAIDLYRQNPDRAFFLYVAYNDRAKAKMQKNANRAAIIDFYYAQDILDNLLNRSLPDYSADVVFPEGYMDYDNKKTYLKGKPATRIGLVNYLNKFELLVSRSYTKYRFKDYSGAIADCNEAISILVNNKYEPNSDSNGYVDVVKSIKAMAQFGNNDFESAFKTFNSVRITEDIIGDTDNDGIINFIDRDYKGKLGFYDDKEGFESLKNCGLPDFFPFDVIQIKGLVFYKSKQTDEAIKIYESLLNSENSKFNNTNETKKTLTRMGGDISAILSTLGSFYFAKGDKKKSIELLDEAIKLNPNQLEYYYKRGTYKKQIGDVTEANKDFEIVKNPEKLKTTKKNIEYYNTKYVKFAKEKNLEAIHDLVIEGLREQVAEGTQKEFTESFAIWGLLNVIESKNATHAEELANLTKNNQKYFHIFRSLHYGFSLNNQKEQEEMFLAFENGLDYNSINLNRLRLKEKPFFCKLMSKYVSKTNNSFVINDIELRTKTIKQMDSLYKSLEPQYEKLKMSATLKNMKKEFYAKTNGEIEQVLEVLNENQMLLEMSSIKALEKIECLFILNRKEEAVVFAKKVNKKNKFMDLSTPGNKFVDSDLIAIKNIANGSCD